MSTYLIVEFTVKDPELYKEHYSVHAGMTAKQYGAKLVANSAWEVLSGDHKFSSGAIMKFPDHETALKWYNSPEYQELIETRGAAMDARFSLLDGVPNPAENESK